MGSYKTVEESMLEIESHEKPSRWRSWRVTVVVGALTSSVVFFINIGLLVWSWRNFDVKDGIATVFEGDCVVRGRINTLGHVAINVFGTILFSASNNCAQLLSSPTQQDITAAHKKGAWMDIGQSSLRNLRHIPLGRTALWSLLMLSSIPLHLLRPNISYNSVLFTSQAGHDYYTWLVTEDFVTGGWWNQTRMEVRPGKHSSEFFEYNTTDLLFLQQHAVAGDLERLENEDCIQSYGLSSSKESLYGNLLVVSSLKLNDTAIAVDFHDAYTDFHDGVWLCDSDGPFETDTDRGMMRSSKAVNCSDRKAVLENAATWTIDEQQWFSTRYGSPGNYYGGPVLNVSAPVSYCLAEPYTPRCAAGLSTTLLAVVAACNAVKIIAMLTCAFWSFEPLATGGDAIAAFLASPEAHSDMQGPLSIIDLRKSRSGSVRSPGPRMLIGKRLRWRHAASQGSRFFNRWLLCFYTSGTILIAAAVLLRVSLPGDGYTFHWGQQSDSDLRARGVNYIFLSLRAPLSLNLILPNLPQLLVSFVYIFYNSAMTSMLFAHEWAGFATHRKSLRVTSPQGQQRSTFWLQLPYRYALPLMVSMATLHWLISQAIFLVKIDLYDVYGSLQAVAQLGNDGSTSAVGYLPLANLLAIILGVILMLALVGLSFRKLGPGMPLVGCCSLAISAACGNTRENKAALKPLKYGVLTNRDPDERQYVGFSQHEVEPLVDGVEYF